MNTYIINMLSEAITPITHMAGVSGNESILNREKVLYNGTVVSVPTLSGNALRHNIFRAPGVQYLLKEYELENKVSITQANFLSNGGRLFESSSTEDLSMLKEMREISPLLKLLGGSLPYQVVAGTMSVFSGVLVCEENKKIIEQLIGEECIPKEKLLSSEHFISKYQYTRGDASKAPEASTYIKDDVRGESNLMIYSGENIIKGALFAHKVTICNASELELGAALNCIDMWQKQGGKIGGSTRIGHGSLSSSVLISSIDGKTDYDCDDLIKAYQTYAKEKKEAFIKWLKKAIPDKESLI